VTTALLVVDTETGGLLPSEACIIEIAAVPLFIDEQSIELGEPFEAKIKPDRPVSAKAAEVNGYTREAWIGALTADIVLDDFRRYVDALCQVVKQPMWCGCNPLFDLKFYNSDRKRHGVAELQELSHRVIDVQSMAFPLIFRGEVRGVSLAKLRAWAGMPDEQKHTALDDVLDTCEVIGALLLKGL
jgi:DNA polymerase III epsilon subunit-like protein